MSILNNYDDKYKLQASIEKTSKEITIKIICNDKTNTLDFLKVPNNIVVIKSGSHIEIRENLNLSDSLLKLATSTFGSECKAISWLKEKNQSLQNTSPLEFLEADHSDGEYEIEALLLRTDPFTGQDTGAALCNKVV